MKPLDEKLSGFFNFYAPASLYCSPFHSIKGSSNSYSGLRIMNSDGLLNPST
jgi:hypothetical protein